MASGVWADVEEEEVRRLDEMQQWEDAEQPELTKPGPKEHLFKVLVVGEFGVGRFSPNYKLTIGVDFSLKVLDWDSETKISLQLWDIAGHERFGQMTRVYYKYAIAALIVFDLSRPATFTEVLKWLQDIHSKVMLKDEQPIPCLLLANKCDMASPEVDTEMLNTFCRSHGLVTWFPTSAKDDVNIGEAVNYLVQHVLTITRGDVPSPRQLSLAGRKHGNSLTIATDDDDEALRRKSSCCK